MASLEKEPKAEEDTDEDASSEEEEEDDLETKGIKSEVLAKMILEEMKGLRFDVKAEIRTVCNHFIKLLNHASSPTKSEKIEHAKTNVPSNEVPASSALQGSNSLIALENTADRKQAFSPSYIVYSNGSDTIGLKYEYLPPLQDRSLDANEFSPELDTPMTTDSASTCSNSDKAALSTSDKDSVGDKEKSIDLPSENVIDDINFKAASNLTQNAASADAVHKKSEKKPIYNIINPSSLNTKMKKQNALKEKRKIKSLKTLSLQDLITVCQTNCKNHLFAVQNTKGFNRSTNSGQLIEGQVSNNLNSFVSTNTPMSVDGIPGNNQDNKSSVLPQNYCVSSLNIDPRTTETSVRLNQKIADGTVVSPLCLPAVQGTVTHKVLSKLKTQDWKYRVAEKSLSEQSTECQSKTTSTTSLCQNSSSVSEIACQLNCFDIDSKTNLENLQIVSKTDDVHSSVGSTIPPKLCQSKTKAHSDMTSGQKSKPMTQNKRSDQKPEIALLAENETNCEKQRKIYRCNVCQRAFSYSWLLKDHMRLHSNENMFQCQVCGKSFSGESCRNRHLLTAHFGAKCYECDQCGKYFSTQESLKLHEKNHSGVKLFSCKVCHKSFPLCSALERHVQEVHAGSDTTPFQCATCKKSFGSQAELVRHSRIHTGEKPYPCKKCGKHFRSAENLQRHVLSSHCDGKAHNCPDCDMSFANAVALKHHIVNHHHENKFQCVECGKTFANPQYLKFHMKNHQGEKSSTCSLCGKGFESYIAMKKHKKGHYSV